MRDGRLSRPGNTTRPGHRLLDGQQPTGIFAGSVVPDPKLTARLAAARSLHHMLTGRVDEAVAEALAVRANQESTQLAGEWNAAVPLILLRVYPWLEDFEAVEREAAAALAAPQLTEPVKLVMVPGPLALAWFEAGRLAEAAAAARAAEKEAQRLGFGQHFFAADYLRVLAGLALERRDLDTAKQLTEQVLSITKGRRPLLEFLALLDRAMIWSGRGRVRDALASVEAARRVLAGTGSLLLARADELEGLLRLSLGDLRSPAQLASRLPAAFLKSLAIEPPIKPGTPDPYTPPPRGQLVPQEYIQIGPMTQFVTMLHHPNGGPPANVRQHQPDHGLAQHTGA